MADVAQIDPGSSLQKQLHNPQLAGCARVEQRRPIAEAGGVIARHAITLHRVVVSNHPIHVLAELAELVKAELVKVHL